MASVEGVTTVWSGAPESDQATNSRLSPATVWVGGAPRSRSIPLTATRLSGVTRGWPSSVTVSPLGTEASDRVTLWGCTST